MKHNNEPFEHWSEEDPIFDFSWEKDWMLVVAVVAMMVGAGLIYLAL